MFTFKIINPKTNKVRALIDVPEGAGSESTAMQRAATTWAKRATADNKATAMICHGNPPGVTTYVPATGKHVHQKHLFRVRR